MLKFGKIDGDITR